MFDNRLWAASTVLHPVLLALIMLFPLSAWSAPATQYREQEEISATRAFLMGFTPFHFSWIEDRIIETYSMINSHSDLIAYHFDEGVPWPEAFASKAFHPNVEAELKRRKEQIRPGGKVYVATTPINFERNGLADYWEEKEQVTRPDEWKDKNLDDPQIIQAYINYCERLIEIFDPAYFVYGVEVNLLAANDPKAYKKFQTLAAAVYPALKKKYPKLPIALSFYLHNPDRWENTREQVSPLLPYTDLFAVSTYPYMAYGEDGFAVDKIPENWLKQTRQIAPEKPFAIAETGYIAEDLKVLTKTMPGSEDGQKRYVARMLREAAELNAEFVIWFVIADYDELWGVLKWAVLFNPLIRAWKDTGLYDGELKPRTALQVWDEWLAKPLHR